MAWDPEAMDWELVIPDGLVSRGEGGGDGAMACDSEALNWELVNPDGLVSRRGNGGDGAMEWDPAEMSTSFEGGEMEWESTASRGPANPRWPCSATPHYHRRLGPLRDALHLRGLLVNLTAQGNRGLRGKL